MDKSPRYSRQIVLPEIGLEGQRRLAAARILCVGAGGLGCPALLYLAAAGVGTIGIIDPDCVEISNLQRQVLFSVADVGQSKAVTAARHLRALNPDITVNIYQEWLTAENAAALFSDYDIIIDGTDNFAAKFLINDTGIKVNKTVVYGAIQGFEGRVSIFGLAGGPCYRCLYASPPDAAIQNCAEAGVVGALAGIVGTAQAIEVIKLIVAHKTFKSLAGRLWMIDTLTMETHTMTVHKKADCPTCSQDRDSINLQSGAVCPTPIREITAEEAAAMKEAVLVDVRELNEWQAGHIEGATFAPLSALKEDAGSYTPPSDRACILYCARGIRSLAAAEILRDAGFMNLYSMKGGYEAWRQRA